MLVKQNRLSATQIYKDLQELGLKLPNLPEDKIAKFAIPLRSINYGMLIMKSFNFWLQDRVEVKKKKSVKSPKKQDTVKGNKKKCLKVEGQDQQESN